MSMVYYSVKLYLVRSSDPSKKIFTHDVVIGADVNKTDLRRIAYDFVDSFGNTIDLIATEYSHAYQLHVQDPYRLARKPSKKNASTSIVTDLNDLSDLCRQIKQDILYIVDYDWDSYKDIHDKASNAFYKVSASLTDQITGEIFYEEDLITADDKDLAYYLSDHLDNINMSIAKPYRLIVSNAEKLGEDQLHGETILRSLSDCSIRINRIGEIVFEIIDNLKEEADKEEADKQINELPNLVDNYIEKNKKEAEEYEKNTLTNAINSVLCNTGFNPTDDDKKCDDCIVRAELESAYEEIDRLQTVISHLLFEKYNC